MQKFLFLILSTLPLFAQQVYEEQKVILRDIRVYVTDRDGKPVKGLTKDDFIISESRKDREISFFEEVDYNPIVQLEKEIDGETVESGAVMEPRFNILVLDSSNMTKRAFEAMVEQSKYFIENNLRPNDLLKIVQIEEKMYQLTRFTKNREKMIEVLDNAEWRGTMRRMIDGLEREVVDYYLNFEEDTHDFRDNFSTDGFANSAAELFLMAVKEKERQKAIHFKTFEQNMLILNRSLERMRGSKSIILFTGGIYLDAGAAYASTVKNGKTLAHSLNATNTTVHSFVHADFDPVGFQRRLTGGKSAKISEHRIIDTLKRVPGIDMNSLGYLRSLEMGSGNSLFENNFQILSGPEQAAETTGGFFKQTVGTAGLEQNFARFSASLNHFYRVGYTMINPKKTAKVKIELKNKGKGWDINYGKKLRKPKDPKAYDEVSLRYMNETTMLYDLANRNDLDAVWHYEIYGFNEDRQAVPVHMDVDLRDPGKKGFLVGFAALDADREVLDVVMTTVTDLGEGRINLHDLLIVDSNPAFIRFYAKNLETDDYSVGEVTVPAYDWRFGERQIGPMVFGDINAGNLSLLNAQRQDSFDTGKDRIGMDPYLDRETYFHPGHAGDFEQGKPFFLFFQVLEEDREFADHEIRYYLKTGPKTRYPLRGELKSSREFGIGANLYKVGVHLDFPPTGTYPLVLEITDRRTGRMISKSASVNVVAADTVPTALDANLIASLKDDPDRAAKFKTASERGWNPHAVDGAGNTALFHILAAGDEVLLKTFLELGVEPNRYNYLGDTILLAAAKFGKDQFAGALIEGGASVHLADNMGNTPLHHAVGGGNEALVRLLLEKGADKKARNHFGHTPYFRALSTGQTVTADLVAVESFNAETKDLKGLSIMHHAVPHPSRASYAKLADLGADMDAKDHDGRTPLMYAAIYGNAPAAELLLEMGVAKDSIANGGYSALMYAALGGRDDVARLLLDKGADKNVKAKGLDALMLAAVKGHLETVKLLAEAGLNPANRDDKGKTAADYARQAGHGAIADFLGTRTN